MHTRRDFIRRVSGGIGAATLAGSLGTPARAQDRPLGFALVGLGNYATGMLAPALQNTQSARLTGIVTGTPEKAERWKAEYGIPEANVYNYETYDQIADNPDIDVIYVVLPNSMHAEYSIRAAEAGKHVMCEKPMAISVEECEAMIAAARDNDRKLGIGYRCQFHPHHEEVMRLGQEQVMGPVKLIEAGFGFDISPNRAWRLEKEMAGGGALMDVGVYCIQATRYVTGEEPVAVTAQEFKTDFERFNEVDETIFFQLEFPSGAAATCSTSYNGSLNHVHVAADRGVFGVDSAYGYSGQQGWRQGPDGREAFPPIEIDYVAASIDHVAEAILNDTEIRISGQEGLNDMKVVEAIYRSIASGQREEIG